MVSDCQLLIDAGTTSTISLAGCARVCSRLERRASTIRPSNSLFGLDHNHFLFIRASCRRPIYCRLPRLQLFGRTATVEFKNTNTSELQTLYSRACCIASVARIAFPTAPNARSTLFVPVPSVERCYIAPRIVSY